MPDHFFIMPGFMLDLKERISCCLFVIFVVMNKALKFFFPVLVIIWDGFQSSISSKQLFFVAVLYIKSRERDKNMGSSESSLTISKI